jgi:hypothetical protein
MFKYFTLLLLIFKCSLLFSQINTDEKEITFACRVKQIEEFIERFNDDDETLIKQYNIQHKLWPDLTREMLLKSLFDAGDKHWDINKVNSFIAEVNDENKPIYIDFFDNDWSAKLECLVIWKKKPERVVLTMKIQKFADGASKWVIGDVDAPFLKGQKAVDSATNCPLIDIPPARNSTTSLHPASHGVGFMNIDQVSEDKLNIENYFVTPSGPRYDDLLVFANEILRGRLSIRSVTSLKYCFFQVKGWQFEVSEFNRLSRNSGWLISKLIRIPQ